MYGVLRLFLGVASRVIAGHEHGASILAGVLGTFPAVSFIMSVLRSYSSQPRLGAFRVQGFRG